ncbi:MAG: hypothetical protein JJE12_15865 [Anaerolineales bacterium]|nr:hypothetical protein [Anaerolineales bacterium]
MAAQRQGREDMSVEDIQYAEKLKKELDKFASLVVFPDIEYKDLINAVDALGSWIERLSEYEAQKSL